MGNLMTIVYSVFVFLLSLAIGSFLNVVIYRLPNKMNLATPPSHCTTCGKEIKWYDNIPIISYIVLRGRCRYCGEKISPRYLIVETGVAVISTLIFLRFGLTFNSLFGILFFMALVAISFIDAEHWIIPDSLVLILIGLGILGIFFNDLDYGKGLLNAGWLSKLIAAGGVVVFFFLIILVEKLLKREIFGGGDIKLMFAAGLILGWELLLLGFGIACLLSCIIQVPVMIKERIKEKKEESDEEKDEQVETDESASLDGNDTNVVTKEEDIESSENDDVVVADETSEEKEAIENQDDEVEEMGEKGHFPFGPYLAIGFIIAYTFGITILEWYISLLS